MRDGRLCSPASILGSCVGSIAKRKDMRDSLATFNFSFILEISHVECLRGLVDRETKEKYQARSRNRAPWIVALTAWRLISYSSCMEDVGRSISAESLPPGIILRIDIY